MTERTSPLHFFLALPNSLFVLIQRAWLSGSGVITVLAVTYSLTSAEQGWYYAFQSVAAISILFDFGLSAILVQVTAKEAIGLAAGADGHILGEGAPRMIGFIKGVQRWYNYTAAACWLLLPVGMLVFHGRASSLDSNWIWPWGLLVLSISASQFVLPWPFILEGLGRIREAYLLRLGQGVVGSLLLWAALFWGAGIYAVAMRPLAMTVVTVAWFALTRPGLLRQIRAGTTAAFAWKEQIARLHGRTAVSWVAGYMLMHLYVPVLFSASGPTVAGRFGLSMTIANTLALFAQSWAASSFPLLAQAAASKDWGRMDHAFRVAFRFGVSLYMAGAGAVLLGCWALQGTHYGSRLLPLPELSVMLLAFFATHIATLLETQVRAYRRDPFALNSAVCALITLVAVFPAAHAYAAMGVASLSAFVSVAIRMPWSAWLFHRSNRHWRGDPALG